MEVIIDFYNSHWTEPTIEVNLKAIPRVGEYIFLESTFENGLGDKKWEVKEVVHTLEDGKQLITIKLI